MTTPQIESAAALYGYAPEEVLEIAMQAEVESHEQLISVLEAYDRLELPDFVAPI